MFSCFMFYVLFFFYGPIVSDTNKCMYVNVCMYVYVVGLRSLIHHRADLSVVRVGVASLAVITCPRALTL